MKSLNLIRNLATYYIWLMSGIVAWSLKDNRSSGYNVNVM